MKIVHYLYIKSLSRSTFGLFLSLISYLFPGVPLHLFFLSVLFGLMPYNYLCVTSGVLLAEISSLQEVLSWANMGRTATIALAALLPSAVRRLRGRGGAKERTD